MSKTVTIPSGDNPFICKINDVYYSYPAGATVSVPDAVAALIQANAGNREEPENKPDIAIPRDGNVNDVLTRTAYGATWKAVPNELPSGGSTNQILTKKSDGGVKWADAPTYTLTAATEAALGGVKMAGYVADVASDAAAAAVRSGLIALITALKTAGIVSDEEPET